jgi:hypothetical protein
MAQMAADPNAPFMRMAAWMTSTVTAAAADEFTQSQVMDSVRMESPAMPAMGAMMGQVADMMRGTATIQRSTSRGRVLDIEVKLSQAMQDMMKSMGGAGGMGGGMGGGNNSPLSSFWLLPEGPVRVGATWRDSMTVALDSAGMAGGNVSYTASFTLRGMEGRVAVIGIDGQMVVASPQLPTPMTLTLAGDTRLDLAAGQMVTTTVDMSGTVTMGPGTEVPMKMHMTMAAK